MMSVREIDRFLEQWEMNARDLHRGMILAPTRFVGALLHPKRYSR